LVSSSIKAGRQQLVLEEKLTESKKLMEEYSETWEQKLRKSERMQVDRSRALERQGLASASDDEFNNSGCFEDSSMNLSSLSSLPDKSPRTSGVGGLRLRKEEFSLVNLNADPSLDGVLLYYIRVSNHFPIKSSSKRSAVADTHSIPVHYTYLYSKLHALVRYMAYVDTS
jgi:hypothetical protein